jgi:hypothetical protein
MKKLNLSSLILMCLAMISCNSAKKATRDIPKATPITMDKEWTLEHTPNGLDVVGVVFALDSTGEPKRIPGGSLKVKVLSAPVAVAQQTFTKNVSAGAIVKFLGIKNIGSASNLSVSDTSHVETLFSIDNGVMTVIDDDIGKAFDESSSKIAANIKLFKLEHAPLYIILETIESPNVNITFDKSKDKSASLLASFKEIISANPQISTNTVSKTDLIYKLEKPITVFYKLQAIDVNVIGSKGTEPERIDLTLGKIVRSDELVYKRKE